MSTLDVTRARLIDGIRRIVFERSLARRQCAHAAAITDVGPARLTCPGCEEQGSQWVHLRMCLTCGSVGCCDSSGPRHARAHFEATSHPVMRSIEPGEMWAWCYPDRTYLTRPEPLAG